MSAPVMHKIVENYILYESIGAGQYGKVFRSKNTQTNETVAVKTIPLQKFAQVPKLEEFTANEIKTLARINNPNVVRFIEMLKTVNNMYLVYEFCEGGTLEDHIRKRRFLPEAESLNIFLQLLNACKAIYRENILHRDLKPSNILLHNGVFKIADFGFCKKVSSHNELTFTMVGSPIYMAPEILKGYPYNIKGDIWSLGVVLYEMLFGICPFEDKTLAGLINQIDRKPLTFPRSINNISKSTEDLLRRMLVIDHRQRIDWNELLDYHINLPIEDKTPVLRRRDTNSNAINNKDAGKIVANVDSLKVPTPETDTLGSKDTKDKEQTTTGAQNYLHVEKKEDLIPKVEMDPVDKYNERLQQKALAEESIMRTLMKERNKVVFLTNIVRTALEHNIGEKVAAVIYLLLKKAYILAESVRREISIENSHSKFKSMECWEDFQITEEFLTYSRYINEEIEEIVIYTAMVKREIEELIIANADDEEDNENILRDSIFETELLSNGNMNERFLHKTLVAYAEEVKGKAQEKVRNREEDGYIEILRHANEILDCVNMGEFFEKTMVDSGLRLDEQRYFAYVRTCDKDKLQAMVNEKLSGVRTQVA